MQIKVIEMDRNTQIGSVSGGLFACGVISAMFLHRQISLIETPDQWIGVKILMWIILCVMSFSWSFAQWRIK